MSTTTDTGAIVRSVMAKSDRLASLGVASVVNRPGEDMASITLSVAMASIIVHFTPDELDEIAAHLQAAASEVRNGTAVTA